MDRSRLSLIGHSNMDVMNPVSAAALERLIDLAGLGAGDEVVDIGAGKGAIALIAAKRGARVTLVERSSLFAGLAREAAAKAGLAGSVTVVELDARAFLESAPGPFDLAICAGASHALGGRDEALSAFSRIVGPSGHLLFGEGFWRKRPSPEYLEALGATEDAFGSIEDNIAAAAARGFRVRAAEVTEGEGFDRYELGWCSALERFAQEHQEDPDAAEIRAIAAHRRDAYERWGKDELGFAVHLLRREPV